MFAFSTTFKLFGAETCVAKIGHALKIWLRNGSNS